MTTSVTTITLPSGDSNLTITGLSDNGIVSGNLTTASGGYGGFVFSGNSGSAPTILAAPAQSSLDIEGESSTGLVVGYYITTGNNYHVFSFSNGELSTIDPLSGSTNEWEKIFITSGGDSIYTNAFSLVLSYEITNGSAGEYLVSYPSAASFAKSFSTVSAISPSGVVAGSGILSVGQTSYSFVDDDGTITYYGVGLESQGGYTASAVNDNGDVAGDFVDPTGKYYAYAYENGAITIGPSSQNGVDILAMNSSGSFLGDLKDTTSTTYFEFYGGNFDRIKAPNGTDVLSASGISADGTVAGTYSDGQTTHGFIFKGGTFTTIDPPGSAITFVGGISSNGTVGGTYFDAKGMHFFTYQAGSYTSYDLPAGTSGLTGAGSFVFNDTDQMAGEYSDTSGATHGFVLTIGSGNSASGTVNPILSTPGNNTIGEYGWTNRSFVLSGTANSASDYVYLIETYIGPKSPGSLSVYVYNVGHPDSDGTWSETVSAPIAAGGSPYATGTYQYQVVYSVTSLQSPQTASASSDQTINYVRTAPKLQGTVVNIDNPSVTIQPVTSAQHILWAGTETLEPDAVLMGDKVSYLTWVVAASALSNQPDSSNPFVPSNIFTIPSSAALLGTPNALNDAWSYVINVPTLISQKTIQYGTQYAFITEADDLAGNTGYNVYFATFVAPSSVAQALQSAKTGGSGTSVSVSDSAANVQSNLSGLQSTAASGQLASIALTDSGTPSLAVTAAQLVGDASVLHAITSPYTLNVTGVAATTALTIVAEDATGRGANGIAAMTAVASTATNFTGNAASEGLAGFQNIAFSGGNDAVVLPGPRSQYAIQILGNGSTQITDSSAGKTVSVTGETYLIFNGGTASSTTSAGAPIYTQFILIPQTTAAAQIAEIYAASFGRHPDLSGLEYWENQFSSHTLDMNGIAYQFVASTEFANAHPAAAAVMKANGTATIGNDDAFVTTLYQSVLNRSPDAGGLAYWAGVLQAGSATPWAVLADFSLSTENLLNIEALTPGDSGWMVAPALSGGYADANFQQAAQPVVAAAAASGFLNLNLLVANATASAGGISVSPTTVNVSQNNTVVVLSSAYHIVALTGSGDYVVGAVTGVSTINDLGSNNNVRLTGNGNIIAYAPGDTITGFIVGQDHLSRSTIAPDLFQPTTAAPLHGSSLTTAQQNFVYVGTLAADSAVAMAAAANLVYLPAATAGESLTFYGQSGTDTVLYHWTNAAAPTSTVTSSELSAGATLIGITAVALSAGDFHS